jgi:leader peptidase (prepilin peptidase)/N-methyltransferase
MLSPLMLEIDAFLVGLLFGSLLNVCIARLPLHESIVRPRSHCPRCGAMIHWYDNIPVLSFILLRAKCRNCKASIPWRYPLVELAVGLWFLMLSGRIFTLVTSNWMTVDFGPPLAVWRVNAGCELLTLALLGFFLIGLAVMDWRTQTLPDAFTLTGTAIGFVLTCVQALFLSPGEADIHLKHSLRMSSPGSMAATGDVFLTGPEALVLGRVGAIVAAAGLVLLIRWLYKKVREQEGMGLGDAKLMAMIAAFLGFWPAILALFVGVILCAVYAVVLMARRRADGQTRLPLGSFLSIGGLIAALFGGPLIEWYRSLL